MTNQAVLKDLWETGEVGLRLKMVAYGLIAENAVADRALLQQEFMRSELVSLLLEKVEVAGERKDGSYDKWFGGHWVMAVLADFPYPAGDLRLLPLRDQQLDWLFGSRHQVMIRKRMVDGRQRRCTSQEGNALFSHLRLGIANERVHDLAQELVRWQWPDGGWNCDMNPEAHTSSFHETLIPLRGLIEYQRHFPDATVQACIEQAKEVFLKRELYLRMSNGAVMNDNFLLLSYPSYWHYDVLSGLKVMAEGRWLDDPRCQKALAVIAQKQLPDGGFPAEKRYYHFNPNKSGYSPVDWGGVSKRRMNPWVTVECLAVLKAACYL